MLESPPKFTEAMAMPLPLKAPVVEKYCGLRAPPILSSESAVGVGVGVEVVVGGGGVRVGVGLLSVVNPEPSLHQGGLLRSRAQTNSKTDRKTNDGTNYQCHENEKPLLRQATDSAGS